MRVRIAVLVVTGIGASMLSWALAQHSLIGARWELIGFFAAWVPLWLLGAWAATKLPRRVSLGAVLLVALALRLVAATGTAPSISNDLWRYSWDARVQVSGTDPYTYPPSAPQLVSLRPHSGVWPTPAQCAARHHQPGCTLLNRQHVRTIYPPVAEAWFVIVHVLAPGSTGSRPWQLAGGLLDMAAILLIIVGLRETGRDSRQVAWYALCPLPVVEFAGNGHIDVLALLLLVAAVLALRRERVGWAGVLVGMATMVKLYPALALAAWWKRGRWRLALAAGGVVVLSELPHVLVAGTRVLGYVPGYFREEHYLTGQRFLLLGMLGLPGRLTTVLAIVVFGLATLYVVRADYEPATALATLLTALLLVVTPVQPWYAALAAGLGALAGAPWLLILGLAGETYYANTVLNDPHQLAYGRLAYGVALVTIVYCAAVTLRQSRSQPVSAQPLVRIGPED